MANCKNCCWYNGECGGHLEADPRECEDFFTFKKKKEKKKYTKGQEILIDGYAPIYPIPATVTKVERYFGDHYLITAKDDIGAVHTFLDTDPRI